jgi:hypothetical protein
MTSQVGIGSMTPPTDDVATKSSPRTQPSVELRHPIFEIPLVHRHRKPHEVGVVVQAIPDQPLDVFLRRLRVVKLLERPQALDLARDERLRPLALAGDDA